ncbi:hypothetical protein Pan44_08900 [Caulifigura coniformis]|uniref:Uncharacterized protein n=1 Tax=Caulifigura coniformis TaxID=2527983 RepID=A0A517S9R5_9PLAN|nr:DUF3365 domain-containing protein [Caulifigura coniformis]QDT52877.1 hypothetical protein Pan44_08900 [Caulifigura coniformis]
MIHFLPAAAIIGYAVSAVLMVGLIASRRFSTAVMVPIPVLFLAVIGLGPTAFIMGVGLLLFALFAWAVEAKWSTFAMLAVVPFAIGSIQHHRHVGSLVQDIDAMRADFPVQSLKERLRFHEEHPVAGGEAASTASFATSGGRRYASRAWKLERLHDESYKDFVAAAGFGSVRMVRVRRSSLELPKLVRTPVASRDLCFDNREVPGRAKPTESDLNQLHLAGMKEFIDDNRMGFDRGPDFVIGFEPHAVASSPAPIRANDETWQVARLELVSLLRHDEPRVYVSDDLPNLDELEQTPTRPLDEFERTHLAALENDQEVVTSDEPTVIRMLGAVRATETCLGCHSVPQKTLLGAFSYDLRPVRHDAPGSAEVAVGSSPEK